MHLSSASQQMICLFSLVIFLCAFTSGVISHDTKQPTHCNEKNIKSKEPKIQIIRCHFLRETSKSLAAVVFIDKKDRLHCINPTAPWLSGRIARLQQNGVECKDYTRSIHM